VFIINFHVELTLEYSILYSVQNLSCSFTHYRIKTCITFGDRAVKWK